MCCSDRQWEPPEFVYIQIEDEWGDLITESWENEEITWCANQIYESDIKYRRIDVDEEPGTD